MPFTLSSSVACLLIPHSGLSPPKKRCPGKRKFLRLPWRPQPPIEQFKKYSVNRYIAILILLPQNDWNYAGQRSCRSYSRCGKGHAVEVQPGQGSAPGRRTAVGGTRRCRLRPAETTKNRRRGRPSGLASVGRRL